MKPSVFVVVTALLASSVAFAAELPQPTAAPAAATNAAPVDPATAPKIEFDKTVFDFGTTSMVQSVSGVFHFKNAGKGPLEFKRPVTSCGCTVASVKPDSLKLAPGEEGEIGFTLSIGAVRGHVEKHISVSSNDPVTPTANLTLKADMAVIFDSVPMQVALGEVALGSSTNITIDVRRMDGKKLLITKIEPSNPFITATYKPIEDSTGTAVRVEMQIKPDGTPRHVYERLNVYAEGVAYPVIAVPIFGQLLGELRVQPEAVFWGIADPTNWPGPRPELMTTRIIRVGPVSTNKTMAIKEATSSLADVAVTVQPLEEGKQYQVVAKLTQAPKESEHGTITIQTDMPSNPTVVIPININVLRR